MFRPLENIMQNGHNQTTEYKNEFRAHRVPKPRTYRPDQYERNYQSMPMQDETTNRHDFIRHPVKKPQSPYRPLYQVPFKMETTTVYGDEFTNKISDIRSPIRHDLNRVEDYKVKLRAFTAHPTYATDYQKWDVNSEKRELCRNERWIAVNDDFKTADSTYDADFIKFDQKPKKRDVSADRLVLKSTTPFSKHTGYEQEFVEHTVPSYYFYPRSDKFHFKTNKRYFKPSELRIIKGQHDPYEERLVEFKKWQSQSSIDDCTPNRKLFVRPETTYSQTFRNWTGSRHQRQDKPR